MKKSFRLISTALCALIAFSSFSIGAAAKSKKYVKSIKVAKSATLGIPYNKNTVSKSFKVTVKAVGGASTGFTAKSDKKSVADVKVSGKKIKVTAKKAGKAVITVKAKAKGKNGKTLSKKLTVTVKKLVKTYNAAKYTVGKDLKAGIYVAYADSDKYTGYYCVSSDEKGENIIANSLFNIQSYVEVTDGQYIQLSHAYLVEKKDVSPYKASGKTLGDGQYLVGFDLPAGNYKLTSTDKTLSGHCTITSDPNGKEYVSGKHFEGRSYIGVKEGQYISLSYCKLSLDPKEFEESYSSDVVANLKKIKDYILENGEQGEDGNKLISDETSSFITQIIYDAAEDKLCFKKISDTGNESGFDLKIGDNENTEYRYTLDESYWKGKATAELNIASFTKETKPEFKLEDVDGISEEDLSKYAQTYLELVMVSSTSVLFSNFKLDLTDIGFRSYGL